ncbi:MAG: AbrB family transcriptional regulator [Clostridiales bacterium]|jgi:membrane AbrB-like protein|nr:AbrB family transcriptional regulator [Clostridiales bacterium]
MELLKLNKDNKIIRLLVTIIIGVIGGLIFVNIHIPLPWVLGPMTTTLIGTKFSKIRLYWPSKVRNWGLIVIGYNIGLSFNKDTFLQIIKELPWMLVMTTILISFCALSALFVSRLSKIDYPSILTGCIPGGLSQMVTLGEEMEGMNLTIITFFQVVRLMLLVFCVPLLVFSPLYSVGKTGAEAMVQAASMSMLNYISKILIFALISIICALLAKKFKFPTPFLLGPILGIAVLNVTGFQGPTLSPIILDIAQFTMGSYLGLMLKPEKLENKVKIISLSILNALVVIFFAVGLSFILVKLRGLSGPTGFLSMAPGGADQMGILASVISADVPMVTSYQVFRILFINIVVPPVLRLFYKYYTKGNQVDNSLDLIKE